MFKNTVSCQLVNLSTYQPINLYFICWYRFWSLTIVCM